MRRFAIALVLVVVVVAACAGTRGGMAEAPAAKRANAARDAGLERLVTAAAAGDAAGVRALLADEVTFGGAWFADAACRRHFAAAHVVPATGVPELARCLATLPLARSARRSSLPGLAVVTYPPGLELEVLFAGTARQPRLRWIGYVQRVETSDALPTITQAAFEALRLEPTPITFDAATEQALAAERAEVELPPERVFTWFKVCANAAGEITRVQARLTASTAALPAFAAWIRTWKLRPFVLAGQPLPVCALVRVGGDPNSEAAHVLPAPVPTPHADALIVASWWLAKRRIAGDRTIVPDDRARVQLAQAGLRELVGTFLLCARSDGAVASVTTTASTGLPSYDLEIMRGMRTWRYRPVVVDGQPVPFCSSLRFTYHQR